MVEVDELVCVVTFKQTICFHHWWDGWSVITGVIVSDFEVSDPAVVNDCDSPESILGVHPPLEDYLPVESELIACVVEVHFTACIA